MDHDFLLWSEFADRSGKLNPVPDRFSAAERGFSCTTIVPVQIAQHEHEGTALPVKIEGLVTTPCLNHVETPILADCRNKLANGFVVAYLKNAPSGGCGAFAVL